MTTPAPGWYDAPDGSGTLRWWNGTLWTADVSPRPSAVGGPTPVPPVATSPSAVAPPIAPSSAPRPYAPAGYPTGPAPARYVPPRKRRVWPWVVGGVGVLVVLTGVVVAISFAVGLVGTAVEQGVSAGTDGSSASAPMDPEETVLASDQAYADQDCAEFQAVVTPDFADSALETSPFTCEEWLSVAAAYNVDGDYLYDVTILGSSTSGSGASATATVLTSEIDSTQPEPQTSHWQYTLVMVDGKWLIDDQTSTDQ